MVRVISGDSVQAGGLSLGSFVRMKQLIGKRIAAAISPVKKELSIDNVVDMIDGSIPSDKHLLSAVSAAVAGDVGAVASSVALYRGMVKVKDIAKERAIGVILNTAYKNGVEHYLRFAEDALDSGRLIRAKEWLMSVEDCILKGNVTPTEEQQKRINVLRGVVSKIKII